MATNHDGLAKVLVTMTADCQVCGEVASERDLYWVMTQAAADCLSLSVGDCVCRDCA